MTFATARGYAGRGLFLEGNLRACMTEEKF